MGPDRSYTAVANHFSVSKQTVVKRATHDGWQAKIRAHHDAVEQETADEALESIARMNKRHLQELRLIQSKALQVLISMPIGTARDAVLAIMASLKMERLIRGEPTSRSVIDMSVETHKIAVNAMIEADYDDRNGHG